jgi:hypothetical protein
MQGKLPCRYFSTKPLSAKVYRDARKKGNKMICKSGGLEERKREVQEQIADVERRLTLCPWGNSPAPPKTKSVFEKKLDITRRHLRALNES